MKIHQISADEAAATLHSAASGLSGAEARRRQAEFGPNSVEKVAGKPVWLAFIQEFSHFFALILWLAAGLAFFAESRQPDQGMATLDRAILGVIAVNGLFAFWHAQPQPAAGRHLQRIKGVIVP